MIDLHPAVQEFMDELNQMFPDISHLTYDEWAQYWKIKRTYSAEHFKKCNEGPIKIDHTPVGRGIKILKLDIAIWHAHHKLVDGKPINPQEINPDGTYRKLRKPRGYISC